MAGTGHLQAGRSTNLFGDRHRDSLALRLVFVQRLDLLRSIADLFEIDIAIPDHTPLSRRGGGLTILPRRIDPAEPLHLLVDSTVELTPDEVGDISELPDLLDQIDADVASMTADGAYDGQVVCDAVVERHPKAAVTVPPRTTAVA